MYILPISITHNKNQNPSLKFVINWISGRSVPQLLSLIDYCTFRFSNFVRIGLCNSLANSWFDVILFSITDLHCLSTVSDQALVTAPPEALAPASPRLYPSYFGFLAISNILSCNILSEAVFLGQCLKSSSATSC